MDIFRNQDVAKGCLIATITGMILTGACAVGAAILPEVIFFHEAMIFGSLMASFGVPIALGIEKAAR